MFRPLIWRLGERIRFQIHSGCQQKSVPCYFRARDPISSLSVILELLSTSFLHPQSQQQSIKFCFCFIFLIFPPVISLLPPFLPHLTSATESSQCWTEQIGLTPILQDNLPQFKAYNLNYFCRVPLPYKATYSQNQETGARTSWRIHYVTYHSESMT